MMRRLFILLLLAGITPSFLSLAFGQPGSCKKGNLSDEPAATVKEATQFLATLQEALRTNDRNQLAELIRYPLSASTQDSTLEIHTPKELEKKYNQIFTTKWRKVMLQQESQCISRVGTEGFTLAQGAMWFGETKPGEMRVFSVNQPVE